MTNQYSVILRAINDNQEKFDLELTNVPQFLLDISAIEAGDIGKVFGISSQEFALPGTDTNNLFFNNLFDLGTTPSIGLTHTVPCQVLVDGQAVYTGKLYLNSIITDQYNDVIYNCAVINETVDFRSRIDTRALADLDWSAYDHTYSWTNISASWNDQLLSGNVMYPLVHYGKDPNNANGAQVEFGGGAFQIDNQNYPLRVTDFKPAIRAKAVLDTIFDTVGYRYTSNFLTSSFFQSLYILPTNNDYKGANIQSTVTQSLYAYPSVNQDIPATSIPATVQFNTEVYDNGSNYSTSTYEYTADVNGLYTFNVVVPFTVGNVTVANDPTRAVIIEVQKNGSVINQYIKVLKQTFSGTIGFTPFQLQLVAGDIIDVVITFEAFDISETFRVKSGTNTFFKAWGPPGIIGSTVNMGLQFPDDLKVIDFINSLILKFNLVIEPVAGTRNLLKIEPFNDWVDQGTVIDWSHKVDRNIKWEIRHPLGDQPKDISFSDKLDEDAVNQYQVKTFKTTYGSYTYTSDSDLVDGEKKIETLFGATPVKVIPGAQGVVLPFLYRQEPNKYGQPFKFSPRLLFKQTLQTVTGTEARGISGSSAGYFYMNDGNTTFPINYYRTLGPNTSKDVDFNTGFDIHYNNLNYWPYQQPQVNGRTKNDAFSNYWSYYINELYDVDTRLVTMNIVLQPDEIQSLQLNSKIFIDGHYYRINKIQGANLIEEQSTKVELLKTLPRRLRFPRRRIYINPAEFEDVIQNDYNENGSTSYSNFETGLAVTSSTVLEQASTRDGNETYGTFTVWDTTKPTVFNPNVTTIGNVDYDETSNNILVVGNDVIVPQNTQNTAILLPGRDLPEYKSETVYIGASVSQNRIATEYVTVTASAGTTYNLTASANQYPFYYTTWSGSAGNFYYDLPDAEDLDGVQYQFYVDSAFTTGSIYVRPSGSQTIEGNPEYALLVTGSTYQFKSFNSTWIPSVDPGAGGGGGGGGNTIDIEYTGSAVVTATTINFTGSGVNVTAAGSTAIVNISGGGGGSAFPYTGSAQITGSLAITGSLSVSTGLTLSGLGNYADDTAAAAGGVPVNGIYRNGNALMIRIV